MSDPRTLTILSVAGSDGVRAAIEAWAATGLLRRSVWLDAAALDALPDHLMGMPVSLVGCDDAGTRALREVFGDEPYRVVRVIAVRQVSEDGVPDDLPSRLWAFAERLQDAVGDASLVRINLLVPGQAAVTVKGLLEPGWDVNVVVSPEDRPREGAVDHGFAGAAEFDAHTALAAVTVGALWDRTESGPFDEQHGHATGKRGTIAVVRAAARVLDARDLPEGIVTQALGDGATSLAGYLPKDLQRVADNEALVGVMFEAFLPVQDMVLYYHDRRPRVPPTPPILPLTLRKLPRFWAELTRLKLEQAKRTKFAQLDAEAEQWLQGFIGGAVFRPSAEDVIDCADGAPASLRPNPLMPQTAPPYEFVWPALRQLCFGLVDGGTLPAEIREKVHGLQPRVGDPQWVVPHPDEGLSLPTEVRQILKTVGLPTGGVRAGDSNAIDRLEQRLTVASGRVADREADDETQQEADLAAIDECVKDLRRWRREGKWERSLAGRLAGHLSEEIAKADAALQRRRKDYKQEEKERNAIQDAIDRVHHHMWLSLSVVLMLGMVSFGWIYLSYRSWYALAVGVFVLVAVGGGGWAMILAAVVARLETRLLEVEARRKATVAAVKEWPSEAIRLGSLYEILLDWAEIIGRLLHQPFGARDATVPPPPDAELSRPQAFRLGVSVVTQERVHDLAKRTVRDAFNAGWLGRLYAAVLDATFPDLGDDPRERDADNDPDKSPAPPRSRMAADAAMAGMSQAVGGTSAANAGGGPNGGGNGGEGAPDEASAGQEDAESVPEHARERLLQSFRSTGGAAVTAMRHATAATRTALLRLPAGALLAGMAVGETVDLAKSESAAEAFLAGALPCPAAGAPCLALAPTLFSDHGMVNGRTAVARVHLWGAKDQPVVEDLAVPEHQQIHRENGQSAAGDREQCRFSLARLDVSDCEETDLAFPM